ncbi:unnamed protein product, partial [Protopolystoma xenopodis]
TATATATATASDAKGESVDVVGNSTISAEERNAFWSRCLSIINLKTAEMLRINSDPLCFTEYFAELKSHGPSFTNPNVRLASGIKATDRLHSRLHLIRQDSREDEPSSAGCCPRRLPATRSSCSSSTPSRLVRPD